jgi:hypothetical protein
VLANVGQHHSLTCGFAVNANIGGGIQIFKTGEAGRRLAGLISARLSVLTRWP